jgi:hypothetical protein
MSPQSTATVTDSPNILDKVLLEHNFIEDILGSTCSKCTLHFSKTVVLLGIRLFGVGQVSVVCCAALRMHNEQLSV